MMLRKKLLSVLLAVTMVIWLIPATAYAVDGEKATNAPVFSDMPDNWSTNALENAVANGLLGGVDGKILPNDNLTRAQMAAVITRAFGANVKGDLSGFSDVKSSDWYADYLAKAYQMGVLKGSAGKMNPNSAITRQEVFAIIARALKMQADSTIRKSFIDVSSISDWAKGEVYALVNSGYIQGSNGKLNPRGLITRAEFAQIFDNIFKQYISSAGVVTKVAAGNIMINVPGVTLKDLTVNGDLIIGDGVGGGEVTLDNVKVTGRVVVRGGGANSIIIRGTSDVSNVVIARVDGAVSVKVQGEANVEVIYIDDGSDDVNIVGTVGSFEVRASDITVTATDADIGTVNFSGENSKIVVDKDSTINTIITTAPGTEITGAGNVTKVEVRSGATGAKITTPSTQIVVDSGVTGVTGGGGAPISAGITVSNNSTGTGVVGQSAGGGGSSGGGNPTPTISVTDVNVINATTVTFESNVAGAAIKWNGTLVKNGENNQLTIIGKNTITVPRVVSGSSNSLAVEKTGYTGFIKNDIVTDIVVEYYTGKDFTRSLVPIVESGGNVTQKIGTGGSVSVTVKNTGEYVDSGFVMNVGTLSDIGGIDVAGIGNYGLNLYFDLDDDSEFFTWNNETYVGVGDDAYALYEGPFGDDISITDSSKFFLVGEGKEYTLSELKAKYPKDTYTGIWVGVTPPGNTTQSATISSITVTQAATTDIPVQYYTGSNFKRSSVPIVEGSGHVAQSIDENGAISIAVSNGSSYIDSGFVMNVGTLENLGGITVKGTGDYGLNLYFDLDGNGFFNWNADGTYIGTGGDTYALCKGPFTDETVIDDSTVFFLMADGNSYTLHRLKEKYPVTTPVGIWVGVTSPNGAQKSAIISSVTKSDAQGTVVDSAEELQGAITAAEPGDTIFICGTIGDSDHYTAYEINKAVTIKGLSTGSKIYGSFVIKADGVTVDGLAMHTRGGGNGPLKAAIDVIAKNVTITNNTFELPNPEALAAGGGVGNGVTIWPCGSGDVNYDISNNIFIGYRADTSKWSSTALQVAEGLDLARFNMGGTASDIVDLGTAEESLAAGNTYVNCTNNYVHSNWSSGIIYKYVYAGNADQLSSALEYAGNGATILLANDIDCSDLTVNADVTLTGSYKVTISDGSTLTVNTGITLTIVGGTAVYGSITNNGTITGDGDWTGKVAVG